MTKNIFRFKFNIMNDLHSLPAEVEWSFYGTPRFKRNKILIVDGDSTAVDPLRARLLESGFEVVTVEDPRTALVRAPAIMPSLIVIEASLPATSGFDLCKLLKRRASTSHIPIILYKSEPTEQERILGFELGADDFVAKPFSPLEMVLRIRNSLERAEANLPVEIKMSLGDLVLDPVRHEVNIRNKSVQVTTTEFRLLLVFMEHCGRMLDREALLREVWRQPGTAATRTVDTHIRRLRSRLGPWARHLESIRGVGYRLNETMTPISSASGRRKVIDEIPSFLHRLEKGKTVFAVGKKYRTTTPNRRPALLMVEETA
jgi:two-component system phosphate regulon response regulator PhoB